MRERALEVAAELVAVHGPHGFKLQDVAERLGVKTPALYHHFESRDDLLIQLANRTSEQIEAVLPDRQEAGDESTLEAFKHGARRLAAFYCERPAAARMILWEIAQGGMAGWEDRARIDARLRERARHGFVRAVENGEIRKIRFEQYMATLTGAIATLALWPHFDETAKSDMEKIQSEAADVVERLLRPDSVGHG
jgi:AcrR family transcriptional regulator